jgi:hypothetical protein
MNKSVTPLTLSYKEQREMFDRLRRIETRLTKYMEWQGFATGVHKPEFSEGDVIIPSKAASLLDILTAVPDEWHGREVRIYQERDMIARLLIE